jgi:hypothetical protein
MMPDAGAGRSTLNCGDAAVERFHRLPEPRTELVVTCQYTGKQSLTFRFGTAAEGLGYVYVEGSEQAPHLMTASGEDVVALFKGWIEFIEMRQSFVNPDPRSPDYFSPDAAPEDIPSLISERLGVQVVL